MSFQDLFAQCHRFSRTWSENAVKPLRQVRTWLKQTGCLEVQIEKDTCMAHREQVKQIELNAEKLQQNTLEALCRSQVIKVLDTNETTVAIANNLNIYF